MDLLTQQEAATMLNVSIRTINRMRQKGQLKTIKLSYRTIRIPRLDVERLIEGSRWNGNQQDYSKEAIINTTSFTQKKGEAKGFRQRQII